MKASGAIQDSRLAGADGDISSFVRTRGVRPFLDRASERTEFRIEMESRRSGSPFSRSCSDTPIAEITENRDYRLKCPSMSARGRWRNVIDGSTVKFSTVSVCNAHSISSGAQLRTRHTELTCEAVSLIDCYFRVFEDHDTLIFELFAYDEIKTEIGHRRSLLNFNFNAVYLESQSSLITSRYCASNRGHVLHFGKRSLSNVFKAALQILFQPRAPLSSEQRCKSIINRPITRRIAGWPLLFSLIQLFCDRRDTSPVAMLRTKLSSMRCEMLSENGR
jgi:hypothetical protein